MRDINCIHMCLMQFIFKNDLNSPATNCGPLSLLTNSCGSPYRANRALKTSMVAFAVVLVIGKASIHLIIFADIPSQSPRRGVLPLETAAAFNVCIVNFMHILGKVIEYNHFI